MKNTQKLFCTLVLGSVSIVFTHSLQAQAAGSQGSDADKTFLTTAAQSDMNEIAVSQVAVQKATDPKVKAFAQRMVTDHNTLETNMKPFADAWGVTPPSGPDAEHQALVDTLNGLSGTEFDKQYMTAMSKDHHLALDAFKTEQSTTQNPKFKVVVSKGEKVVAQHTTMADKMVNKGM